MRKWHGNFLAHLASSNRRRDSRLADLCDATVLTAIREHRIRARVLANDSELVYAARDLGEPALFVRLRPNDLSRGALSTLKSELDDTDEDEDDGTTDSSTGAADDSRGRAIVLPPDAIGTYTLEQLAAAYGVLWHRAQSGAASSPGFDEEQHRKSRSRATGGTTGSSKGQILTTAALIAAAVAGIVVLILFVILPALENRALSVASKLNAAISHDDDTVRGSDSGMSTPVTSAGWPPPTSSQSSSALSSSSLTLLSSSSSMTPSSSPDPATEVPPDSLELLSGRLAQLEAALRQAQSTGTPPSPPVLSLLPTVGVTSLVVVAVTLIVLEPARSAVRRRVGFQV